MSRFINNLFILGIFLLNSLAFANTEALFKVTESGNPAVIDVILCLNGKGPLSCEKRRVFARNLQINTAVKHNYPAAGIKILTPNYQAIGCDPYMNGYCLFSASNTATAEINLNFKSMSGYAIPLFAPYPVGSNEEYTAQVTVGNQVFAMVLDTGSTTLAVAGVGCSGCAGVSPFYMPSSSATPTGLTDSSEYADGSGWSGSIYKDNVGFGKGSPSVSLDIVDIDVATGGFFSGQNDYQGIIGLGPSQNADAGTTGYIPGLAAAGVPNIFSFQLCDSTGDNAGTMWLGGDGSPSNAVYTPLAPISNNNPYYAINVNSMFLGETIIAENASNTFAQPVLDTGTSLFYVPTSVYTTFVSALEASVGFQTIFGSNRFATGGPEQGCVTDVSVTSEQVEAYLPSIILSLPNVLVGHADVAIQASALDTYIYSNGGGQYCLAIQDGGTQDPSTFGDAFLQGFHTIIDIDNSRVGFAKTRCAPPTLRQFNKNRVHSSPHRGPHRNPRTRGSR